MCRVRIMNQLNVVFSLSLNPNIFLGSAFLICALSLDLETEFQTGIKQETK
jgi:hypothetical protein